MTATAPVTRVRHTFWDFVDAVVGVLEPLFSPRQPEPAPKPTPPAATPVETPASPEGHWHEELGRDVPFVPELPDEYRAPVAFDADDRVEACPPVPTDELPGTAGKLRVMTDRAAAGRRMWHPDDAKAIHPDSEPEPEPVEDDGDDTAEIELPKPAEIRTRKPKASHAPVGAMFVRVGSGKAMRYSVAEPGSAGDLYERVRKGKRWEYRMICNTNGG